MDREKKITPITAQDIQAVINSSVMGAGNRLVGNATEQKQILVRPIANTDNKPNVMSFIQRVADEAEKAIEEVAEKSADISTEGLQPSIDEALETASKTIVGAINELRRQLAKATVLELTEVVSELPEVGEPNKFYLIAKETTDANDLYDEWIWVNKGTKDNPDYKWEYTGAKKIEFNADEYVKFTDYATASKAGVFKVDAEKGFTVGKDGVASIYQASSFDIDQKRNLYKPITPFRLDYAVKAGMTDNKKEWTNEDKAKACETIGAVAKQANTSTMNVVYGEEHSGKGQKMFTLASGGTGAETIPMRNANGQFDVGTPQSNLNVANKKYVDDNKGTKLYLHDVYIKDAAVGMSLRTDHLTFISTNPNAYDYLEYLDFKNGDIYNLEFECYLNDTRMMCPATYIEETHISIFGPARDAGISCSINFTALNHTFQDTVTEL